MQVKTDLGGLCTRIKNALIEWVDKFIIIRLERSKGQWVELWQHR